MIPNKFKKSKIVSDLDGSMLSGSTFRNINADGIKQTKLGPILVTAEKKEENDESSLNSNSMNSLNSRPNLNGKFKVIQMTNLDSDTPNGR